MDLIYEKLPFEHNGLFINTDYRNGIKFELLMQDNEISDEEKIYAIILLFFDNEKNNLDNISFDEAIQTILWFYKCGKEEKTTSNKATERPKQIYSYEFDDMYIYSAFKGQYGIDLTEVDMHWWKFKALFQGLEDDRKIVQIMSYRAIDLSKIKDKEEKKRYKQLKKIYALPDMRTAEQKEADFGRAFW